MLNLLIAIISETYDKVRNNANNALFQDMASMIAENSYLIPLEVRQRYARKNKLLITVTNLQENQDEEKDEVLEILD